MKLVGRTMTVATAGVLLGALTACGSSGSKASGDGAAAAGRGTATAGAGASAEASAGAGTASPQASTGGAGASPGAAAGGAPAPGAAPSGGTAAPGGGPAAGTVPMPVWSDAATPLLDYRAVLQLMPDQTAMTGWEQEKRRVDLTDHSADCQNPAACNGKPLSGEARFSSGDVVARFLVDTLPTKAAAQDKLKAAYAAYGDATRYHAVELPAIGTESRAWQGEPGGRDGIAVVMRAGTVVATVTTEDGPVDTATAQRLAVLLAKRIEQAQAGQAADAVLGR
ncbi:hypothetical protein ACIF6L_27465 [Kitasatospora sp. NPDC086009]|uniref:hypothetical protein n=1 Tax=unclassified Kitasatospora TaxID=2633591 RepID=UPI0037CADE62